MKPFAGPVGSREVEIDLQFIEDGSNRLAYVQLICTSGCAHIIVTIYPNGRMYQQNVVAYPSGCHTIGGGSAALTLSAG